jgi:hypothetical protein
MRRIGGGVRRVRFGVRHDGTVDPEVDEDYRVMGGRLTTAGGLSFAPVLSIETACATGATSGSLAKVAWMI